jgi:hypothetical protein
MAPIVKTKGVRKDALGVGAGNTSKSASHVDSLLDVIAGDVKMTHSPWGNARTPNQDRLSPNPAPKKVKQASREEERMLGHHRMISRRRL